MKKKSSKLRVFGNKPTVRTALIALSVALLVALPVTAFVSYRLGVNNERKHADSQAQEESNFSSNTAVPAVEEEPFNETTFRKAFLANCVIQAETNLSKAAAKAYCTCVLDQGLKTYGTKRFIEINQKIMQTYDMSELKDLITECASKATT